MTDQRLDQLRRVLFGSRTNHTLLRALDVIVHPSSNDWLKFPRVRLLADGPAGVPLDPPREKLIIGIHTTLACSSSQHVGMRQMVRQNPIRTLSG